MTPEPVTPEQEREWRATHVESSGRIGGDSWCQICGIRGEPADGPWWPCPVMLSLNALAASRAENERLRADVVRWETWHSKSESGACGHHPCHEANFGEWGGPITCVSCERDTLKAENADMSEQLRVSLDAACAAVPEVESPESDDERHTVAALIVAAFGRLKAESAAEIQRHTDTGFALIAAIRERDSAMKALREYGERKNTCLPAEGCICGLYAALTPAPAEEGKRDE